MLITSALRPDCIGTEPYPGFRSKALRLQRDGLRFGFRCSQARGHFSALDHFFQNLPVTKGIHRPPEALVFVGHELAVFHQATEGLQDELFAFFDVVEDLVSEDEISAVDPDPRFLT